MKNQFKIEKQTVTAPMLKDLVKSLALHSAKENGVPAAEPTRSEDTALYQDSGSGYNTDYTFPQE